MAMTRLYYDEKKKKWLDVPERYTKKRLGWKDFEKETGNLTINLHNMLKVKLDNIKKIVKRKWDAVFIIDGMERIGKSTLGMTAAWYLSDAKLTIDNFAVGMSDAAEKIEKLPEKSILFVDEGSLVFNSKDTMNRESKKLQKILDVVGQKNMIFIVVLPSFFDLNKNIATRRSKFLLHVYTASDMRRGRFSYFGPNKKRKLYELGKKNFGSYNKPKSDWLGNFDDFKLPFNDEYIELKKKSLQESLDGPGAQGNGKIKLGLIKAMIIKQFWEKIEPKIKQNKPIYVVDCIDGFNVSSRTFYRYLESEIPDYMINIGSQKLIDVDTKS